MLVLKVQSKNKKQPKTADKYIGELGIRAKESQQIKKKNEKKTGFLYPA